MMYAAGESIAPVIGAMFSAAELADHSGASKFLGIPLALVGAVLLAFGAQYQSRGVTKIENTLGKSSGGLSFKHLVSMLRRPSWVVGTLLLGLAVVFQIGSLSLSPITIVQPIGVVGLVVTSILNSRIAKVRLGKRVKASIALAVVGITAFVTIASFTTYDRVVTDKMLIAILITFAVILLASLVMYAVTRHSAIALWHIVSAGVLYGFVATFAKVLISRFQQEQFETLTWVCVAALAIGGLAGMLFVQNAYSSGPPDLVVAGLTVIDPMIAVLIGIVILHEAAGASVWAYVGFAVTGIVSMLGVLGLAKYHPQVSEQSVQANAEDAA